MADVNNIEMFFIDPFDTPPYEAQVQLGTIDFIAVPTFETPPGQTQVVLSGIELIDTLAVGTDEHNFNSGFN